MTKMMFRLLAINALFAPLLLSTQLAHAQFRQPQADLGEAGRWSTTAMIDLLSQVIDLADGLAMAAGDNATCVDEPRICQDIHDRLEQVYDHAYYVFHHNTDFSNQCLHAYLDDVHILADDINYWNDWLWAKYYNLGLADMAQQISDYQHWPLCASAPPPPVVQPPPPTRQPPVVGQGGGGSSPRSGVTANMSIMALNGVRACSSANLKSGIHWYTGNPNNPMSRNNWYEHGGYLCHEKTTGFYVKGGIDGVFVRFNCSSGWNNCERAPHSDAKYIELFDDDAIYNNRRYRKGELRFLSGPPHHFAHVAR